MVTIGRQGNDVDAESDGAAMDDDAGIAESFDNDAGLRSSEIGDFPESRKGIGGIDNTVQ